MLRTIQMGYSVDNVNDFSYEVSIALESDGGVDEDLIGLAPVTAVTYPNGSMATQLSRWMASAMAKYPEWYRSDVPIDNQFEALADCMKEDDDEDCSTSIAAGIRFHEVDPAAGVLRYTMVSPTDSKLRNLPGGDLREGKRQAVQFFVNSAFMRQTGSIPRDFVDPNSAVPMMGTSKPVDRTSCDDISVLSCAEERRLEGVRLQLPVLCFVLTLLMPLFVQRAAVEIESGSVQMTHLMGLTTKWYLLYNAIFDLGIYYAFLVFVLILGAVSQMILILELPGYLFLGMLLYGPGQLAISAVITGMTRSSTSATVTAYTVALTSVGLSLLLCFLVFSPVAKPPFFLMLFPIFCFVRMAFLASHAVANLSLPSSFHAQNLGICAGYLVVGTLIWFAIAFLLHMESGELWSQLRQAYRRVRHGASGSASQLAEEEAAQQARERRRRGWRSAVLEGGDDEQLAEDRASVIEERERVLSGRADGDALVVKRLTKVYTRWTKAGPRYTVALDDVCFALGDSSSTAGTCVGVLGLNGAGKSTLLNCLDGFLAPTSGNAKVNGRDLVGDRSAVQRTIGVCPQRNAHFATLTVREHLLFYARIKGVPKEDEMAHVQKVLEDCSLEHMADRQANALSGGFKRRLSLAIALTGESKLLIVDEVCEGLDTNARKVMWDIVSKVKEGRNIILTTHDWKEANTLCEKVVVLHHGRVETIGTPDELKQTFANEVHIRLSYSPKRRTQAIELIHSIIADAGSMLRETPETSMWRVHRGEVVVSELLEKLERAKKERVIRHFGVSPAPLEEAFLNIIKGSDVLESGSGVPGTFDFFDEADELIED
jgi:ABC-type multidrug transport system ATPase subunit